MMTNDAISSHHKRFDAAIVDLDGTLVDTVGDFVVALNRALQELGLPVVDRDFVVRTIGKGSEHLLRQTLAHVGACSTWYERAWTAYQAHYRAINGQHAQVFEGVQPGLQALRGAGLRLVCLTNKPLAFAEDLLAKKGLDGYFERVYGGDSFAVKKPNPLPLIEACKALGTAPSRTLMIGDSSNDAEAAHAAGCPVALVSYGYNHGRSVREVPAQFYWNRLDDWTEATTLSPSGA